MVDEELKSIFTNKPFPPDEIVFRAWLQKCSRIFKDQDWSAAEIANLAIYTAGFEDQQDVVYRVLSHFRDAMRNFNPDNTVAMETFKFKVALEQIQLINERQEASRKPIYLKELWKSVRVYQNGEDA